MNIIHVVNKNHGTLLPMFAIVLHVQTTGANGSDKENHDEGGP